jgi:hypothetical protein
MPGIALISLPFVEEFEESFDVRFCWREALYVKIEISRTRATTPADQTLTL